MFAVYSFQRLVSDSRLSRHLSVALKYICLAIRLLRDREPVGQMTKKFTMQTLTNPLAHGLIRDDAKNYFVEHLEQIYDIWIPLLEKTTLQPNEASDDSRLGNAFKALRQHIVSPNLLKSRLGAVQLTKLMVLLKGEITTDHGAGRIAVEETSKSIAIDAYLQACGPLLDRSARDQALKWVSMSKRWHDLTRGSPLLAVIHSPKAEHVV